MTTTNRGQPQQQQSAETFPWISAADTRIVLANGIALNIQSDQLRKLSRTFETMIPADQAPSYSAKARREGAKTSFFLVLQEAPPSDDGDNNALGYVLEPLILEHKGLPLDEDAAMGFPSEFAGTMDFKAFYDVLGAFYGRKIELGPVRPSTIERVFTLIDKITEVAQYLNCVKLITGQIETHLLSNPTTTNLTHRTIATSPIPWLHLADRLQSKPLFSEALIHAAGQWNTPTLQNKLEKLRPELRVLLGTKGELLRKKSKDSFSKLSTFYPYKITRERTLGVTEPKSNNIDSYRCDMAMWLALTVFRAWATKAVANDETHNAEDMGWEFWRAVEDGGEAYLGAEEVEKWFERFPMSGKGPVMVKEELKALKEGVGKVTGNLFLECAGLKSSKAFPVKWFTCTFVREEDYLWFAEEEAAEKKRQIEAEMDSDADDDDEEMEDA